MNPRSEPLLWLQLVAFGAIPLELLLLLLLLAGADPGPLPGLERLLLWGLGVLAPTLLLWRRPADCCSLLVVQVPEAGRSSLQQRLGELQVGLVPRLLLVLGSALLLPLLWWVDTRAVLAAGLSPLSDANRLISLLLAMPVLALLTWQWQQLTQSVWLLTRPAAALTAPGASSHSQQQRLSLGLPLLLLAPLASAAPAGEPTGVSPGRPDAVADDRSQVDAPPKADEATAAQGTETPSADPIPEPTPPSPEPSPGSEMAQAAAEDEPAQPSAAIDAGGSLAAEAEQEEPSEILDPVAVEPEQAPANDQSDDLDQEIA